MSDDIPANERYIFSGAKKLRCGFTTGTCAALASRAAVQSLLSGWVPQTVSLRTPKGWLVHAAVIAEEPLVPFAAGGESFCCGIQKDAGDDPDVTDGCIVFATVTLRSRAGDGVQVTIEGGAGVGRVTKAGLDQPIGAAAINRVPRAMIADAVRDGCEAYGFTGDVAVTISIPDGERLATRTFNPQLGIVGGISVIGTSGVVEPMSEQALLDALETEIRVIAAEYETKKTPPKERILIITPGNYGKDFATRHADWNAIPQLKCANFVGNALDLAAAYAFAHVILVGHAGKLVKLAGGIMNTHSRVADCRQELLCAHAALCGASKTVCARIMDCATVDAALSVLDESELTAPVVHSLILAAREHIAHRVNGAYTFDIIMFTNERGALEMNGG